MIKKLFIIVVLFITVTACKSKSAYNYSEDIVSKEQSLTPEIEATENKVEKFIEASQYDSIAVAGENMEKMVQQKIDEINEMPVPDAKGADDFKAATVRYFKYIKSLYSGYKKLGKAATEEERQEVISELQLLVKEKPSILSDMQSAQRKFAESNGFKVK
ncbi:MAG: hypothetical protein H7Y01_08160 [Ferruginibacter sp.]|nr:hypothetical protein [Chitinophagaceae bacterium]